MLKKNFLKILTSKDGKSFATYLKTNESLTSLDISLGNPDISFIDLEAIGNVINKNYIFNKKGVFLTPFLLSIINPFLYIIPCGKIKLNFYLI